jgi:hypothetical protein
MEEYTTPSFATKDTQTINFSLAYSGTHMRAYAPPMVKVSDNDIHELVNVVAKYEQFKNE